MWYNFKIEQLLSGITYMKQRSTHKNPKQQTIFEVCVLAVNMICVLATVLKISSQTEG